MFISLSPLLNYDPSEDRELGLIFLWFLTHENVLNKGGMCEDGFT